MADISKIQIENTVYDVKDTTARNEINKIIPPKAFLNRKYLFVGDSYAVGYQGAGITNIEGYFSKVVGALNLNAQIVCENGYGFIGMSSGLSWLNLLQNTTIPNKDSFTDVIICGGMNDRDTDQNIETAMTDTFTYIHTNFPNATIHVGCVGRYAKQSNEQNIVSMRRIATLYKIISISYGNKYIDNSDLLLHNMSYFISDDIHPNVYGENQLAYGIKQYIVNGIINDIKNINRLDGFQIDTITPENNISLTNFNMYSWINNSITTVGFHGAIAFSNAINISNLSEIKIGRITNSYLCGSVYNQGLGSLITGYIYTPNQINGSNFVKVLFRIRNDQNNDLYLRAFTVLDEGGILNNISITEISFPMGVISFNVDNRCC